MPQNIVPFRKPAPTVEEVRAVFLEWAAFARKYRYYPQATRQGIIQEFRLEDDPNEPVYGWRIAVALLSEDDDPVWAIYWDKDFKGFRFDEQLHWYFSPEQVGTFATIREALAAILPWPETPDREAPASGGAAA